MAESATPKIEYRHNVAKEQHEIGVKTGKTFVPFSTVSDAYYAQLSENAKQIAETEGSDDGGEEATE
jgi:hypothetical protein